MYEICYTKDIFLLPLSSEAAAVTTNGIVKANGCAVMGAGIAKYARDNFPGVDRALGLLIRQGGSHAYYLGEHSCPARIEKGLAPTVHVVTFPTKNHWQEKSDLGLIAQSCRELMALAADKGLKKIYIPMPGCSNGRLDYIAQVRPVIAKLLDGRFICCLDADTFNALHKGGSADG